MLLLGLYSTPFLGSQIDINLKNELSDLQQELIQLFFIITILALLLHTPVAAVLKTMSMYP